MDLFGLGRVPYLSRRNYYYEFCHLWGWGLLAGVVEGNLASIVVVKTFNGGDFLVATASATPMGALLFSAVWGLLCVGRPKLRLATMFGAGTALMVATVGLTPHSRWGGVLFVVQMALAQLFLSGVVTLRAAMWKHNYPPDKRGVITARLQALRMMTALTSVWAASVLFDYKPESYRWVYPAIAGFGAVGLVVLQRLHVRRERSELRSAYIMNGSGEVSTIRYDLRALVSPRQVTNRMWELLRTDRRYTRFLGAQMLLGVGTQMVLPVLVITLDKAFALYWINTMIMEVLPKLLSFGSLRRWGCYFDRVNVSRFRVLIGLCAVVAVCLGLAGTLTIELGWWRESFGAVVALGLFAGRSVMLGLQHGGGTLAWNLGHLHFAKREDAELYLGVHVSLTGVRGLIAPFVGVALAGVMGWGVWCVACALCGLSVIGFYRLAREDSPERRSV